MYQKPVSYKVTTCPHSSACYQLSALNFQKFYQLLRTLDLSFFSLSSTYRVLSAYFRCCEELPFPAHVIGTKDQCSIQPPFKCQLATPFLVTPPHSRGCCCVTHRLYPLCLPSRLYGVLLCARVLGSFSTMLKYII